MNHREGPDWYVKMTYPLVKSTALNCTRLIWVRDVTGLENIPRSGGALLAFNHQSYLDFLCFTAVCPRKLHYLAAERFFERGLWMLLMKATGQLRVERTSPDKEGLNESVTRHLQSGSLIGIFPEGTRSGHPTDMRPAFTGVARFAIAARVPVIPVGIRGAYEVFSRHDSRPRFERRISFHVGEPLRFDTYEPQEHSYHHATRVIMARIAHLSGRNTASPCTAGTQEVAPAREQQPLMG